MLPGGLRSPAHDSGCGEGWYPLATKFSLLPAAGLACLSDEVEPGIVPSRGARPAAPTQGRWVTASITLDVLGSWMQLGERLASAEVLPARGREGHGHGPL